ncbi:glucose 1-dehydrogenase [Parahaliea mediterranea]|uniref:glucose 1-dehydrogenase n=1 Tax=Parahaliea mediterranea TaxID=651086 RepID=UPI000E2FBBDC|nr:glucose 1-dehydrogenase [Parahaliea mediterranea]
MAVDSNDNKVALITGAASGLGRAQALRFSRAGVHVVITDIDTSALQALEQDIAKGGGAVLALAHDVTRDTDWEAVITAALAQFGRLDILVNNAGVGLPKSVEDTSLDEWRALLAVNLDGVFLGTKAAIVAMKSSGGSIVNISSIEGIIGDPLTAAYNASKGGVRIFTKSAALHCAEQGYGIRINSVHPGFVNTPLVSDGLASLPPEEGAAFLQRIVDAIPMGRMGLPEEIANAVFFLASDEASYMTGSELVIDGGYTAK